MKKDNGKVCLKRDEIQFNKSENKRPHGFLEKKKTWQPLFYLKHHSNKINNNKKIDTHSKLNVKSLNKIDSSDQY